MDRTHSYQRGQKYRVIRAGASLHGVKVSHLWNMKRWSMRLPIGTVITCCGPSMAHGDGIEIIKWADAAGNSLAIDCAFSPSEGVRPDDSYLQPFTP